MDELTELEWELWMISVCGREYANPTRVREINDRITCLKAERLKKKELANG